jgi:hypothetical protein
MFRTQEQINEVAERTGVSPELVRELGQMMSKVKIAQEDLQNVNKADMPFADIQLGNSRKNLGEALTYFEDVFLKCKLW